MGSGGTGRVGQEAQSTKPHVTGVSDPETSPERQRAPGTAVGPGRAATWPYSCAGIEIGGLVMSLTGVSVVSAPD